MEWRLSQLLFLALLLLLYIYMEQMESSRIPFRPHSQASGSRFFHVCSSEGVTRWWLQIEAVHASRLVLIHQLPFYYSDMDTTT